MDMQKMKLGAGAVAGAIVLAGGGYAIGTWMTKPELVAVSSVGCGTIGGGGSFGVPLQTAGLAAPSLGFTYGPIDYPSAGGELRLAFDREADGKQREVTLVGDTLLLPMTFGNNNQSPERITVTCRNNEIATVRYNRGRAGTTFNVVRQEMSEAPDETEPAAAS
jgi:hypothetical protein